MTLPNSVNVMMTARVTMRWTTSGVHISPRRTSGRSVWGDPVPPGSTGQPARDMDEFPHRLDTGVTIAGHCTDKF